MEVSFLSDKKSLLASTDVARAGFADPPPIQYGKRFAKGAHAKSDLLQTPDVQV